MFQLLLPAFNPNFIALGPLRIRWYSMAYICGVAIGYKMISHLDKKYRLGLEIISFYDDFIFYMVLGIICGGRIGYVLFYEIGYFLANPLTIFFLWRGGMSFHGGFLGVFVAALFLAKKYKLDKLLVFDLLAVASPAGIFLGRMANFINLELYGRPTKLPWGMVFPTADNLARHPSQLYEAFFEGVVILAVMLWLTKTKQFRMRGLNSGVFLILYSLSRIFLETLREPNFRFDGALRWVTMGQILSIPLLLGGIILLCNRKIVASPTFDGG
ncbi:MAG: prolipoprotein diacylglyceryl transferase [Rickettsiales bacterium]|jgi:phosphatidylglycerol:prolipoprotein diacylglycerol transferase|nr:prolipoprotein diacylglyceryl transferase [Rickettsiales bacterium]